MTTQLLEKNCDGGHYTCSPPKECCKQGCCYLVTPSLYRPPASIPTGTLFNPLFLGHWYFWLAVTATVAGILCVCSLWRRSNHGSGFCCRDAAAASRDDRASEPDSNGSCYMPPQYSRCNSFHQAPPPYSEVTSKPDLYPLVISYNGENVIKHNSSSTGFLMVQYFRNFIIRPVGSLSATSTIDSLSSSFICNATNEANTIIPPTYSCMGSLEEVSATTDAQHHHHHHPLQSDSQSLIPRSASLASGTTSDCHQILLPNTSLIESTTITPPTTTTATTNRNQNVVSIRNNPCFCQNATNIVPSSSNNSTVSVPTTNDLDLTQQSIAAAKLLDNISSSAGNKLSQSTTSGTTNNYANSDSLPFKINLKKLNMGKFPMKETRSQDSDDDHNFSDLLNLSAVSASITQPPHHLMMMQELHYHNNNNSVTNSMTGSDISSLANLGTPDSPPRATSPTTGEMKELLDKIQQLPLTQRQLQDTVTKANTSGGSTSKSSYFSRGKAKTLYMPLVHHHHNHQESGKLLSNKSSAGHHQSHSKVFAKSWLSRSAPTTPCTNFVPSFPLGGGRKSSGGGSHKNSRTRLSDGSPLLRQHDESEEDLSHKDERL